MKTMKLTMCCGLSALALISAAPAMSQDRVTGTLSLTALTGNCPSTLALADQAAAVDFQLPETGTIARPAVQNRFRFNYGDPVAAVHSVTITGQIADYAVRGCTVAFKGEGMNVD